MIEAHNLSPQENVKKLKHQFVKKKEIITKSIENNATDVTILLSMASHTFSMKKRLNEKMFL